MKTLSSASSRRRLAACCLIAAGVFLVGPRPAAAVETGGGDIVAVAARVSEDYVRTRQPDGSFQPEAYAFGEGGQWGGALQDFTIDQLKFLDVARTMAAPLASQNYLPTKVAGEARLLIMVYWGTTAGTSRTSDSVVSQNLSVSMQHLKTADSEVQALKSSGGKPTDSERLTAFMNRQRALSEMDASLTLADSETRLRGKTDLINARLLGYNATGLIETDYGRHLEFTALRSRERDLIEEVEDNRYFVVLMAYDFQLLQKEKKHKLLWETRFSIRERGNDFSQALAGMALNAARYFGQDSHGLRRKPLPEGHVKLDDLKILEVVPDNGGIPAVERK